MQKLQESQPKERSLTGKLPEFLRLTLPGNRQLDWRVSIWTGDQRDEGHQEPGSCLTSP